MKMKMKLLTLPKIVLLCNGIFLSLSMSLIAQEYELVWSDEFDKDGNRIPRIGVLKRVLCKSRIAVVSGR